MFISHSTSAWLVTTLAATAATFTYDVPPAYAQPVLTMQQQALYDDAVQAFRTQRYAGAYGRFTRLADAGHEASARLALTMLQHDAELFGNAWSATPGQLRHWQQLTQQAPMVGDESTWE